MFDIKAQTQLASASADMLRAYALAAAHATNLSAYRTIALWAAWSCACLPPAADFHVDTPRPSISSGPSVDGPFASYRSSGGHAVAQVIVG